MGFGVEFNGVMFDGCRESDGTLLEAKSISYQKFMVGDNGWKTFYTGVAKIMNQASDQSEVAEAAGRQVEWYFAEKPVADHFRARFDEAGYTNIRVFYRPHLPGQSR